MQLQLVSFSSGEYSGSAERFAPWIDRGIRHGFFGAIDGFSALTDQDKASVSGMPWGSPLHLLNQVHGDDFVSYTSPQNAAHLPSADGWILPRGFKGAFAIKTADCVPIFALCGTQLLVIHAGWRGIAAEILPKALESALSNETDCDQIEVILGPCAGAERYEVKQDVIDALGTIAVVRGIGDGSFLLDLRATIKRQLEKFTRPRGVPLTIHSSQICTISDARFHSYRREGTASGRNLAVVWQG